MDGIEVALGGTACAADNFNSALVYVVMNLQTAYADNTICSRTWSSSPLQTAYAADNPAIPLFNELFVLQTAYAADSPTFLGSTSAFTP